jgi:PAS domain S-box-containing protein
MQRLTPEAFTAALNAASPFSMVMDDAGRFVFVGRGMAKLVPDALQGRSFAEVFVPARPATDREFLLPGPGLRFFHDRAVALRFKASVVSLGPGLTMVAANPLITAEQSISTLGLTLGDLPPHDTLGEFTFMQQTYQSGLQEARLALDKARDQAMALRAVLDSSLDQIAVVDMEGRVVRWNLRAEEFHGIGGAAALGRDLGSLVLNGGQARLWNHLLAWYRRDPQAAFLDRPHEIVLQDRNGRGVPVELRISAFEHGQRYLRINAHDITDRLRADLELRQREAHYRSIISNMDLGLMVVDLEERIISVNAAMSELLGVPEHRLVGQRTVDIIRFADPEQAALLQEHAQRERLQGRSGRWEVAILRPDGEPRHVLISGAPRHDVLGRVIGSIGIHLDITDPHHMAQELERRRRWFEALVDNLPGATFLARALPTYQPLFVSDYIVQLTGHHPAEYTGGTMDRYTAMHTDDATAVRDRIAKAMASREEYVVEYRVRHQRGPLRWVREVGRFYEEGDQLLLSGNVFDITTEREVQEEARLNTRLVEALATSTAALLESPDVMEAIGVGMVVLGGVLGLDRISLYKLGEPAGQAHSCGTILKWRADDPQGGVLRMARSEAPLAHYGPVGDALLDMRAYSTEQQHERHPGLRSFMAAEGVVRLQTLPLRTAEGPWGFLCFDLCKPGPWRTASATAILEAYGSAVSEALDRDRIGAARQLDLEVEQAINRLASAMLGHSDEEALLWEVVERVAVEFGLEHCVIYRFDDERGCVLPRAAWRDGARNEEFALNGPAVCAGDGIVGDVMRHRHAERIADTSIDPRYVPDQRARASELVVPILFGDRLLGVINSENDRPAFYGEKHQRTLSTIASMLSAQLVRLEQQAHVEQERRTRTDLQQRLNDELAGALTERSARLRELEAMSRYPDSNPNPVLRFAMDGRLQYANAAAAPVMETYALVLGAPLPEQLSIPLQQGGMVQVSCGDREFELLGAPVPEFAFVNVYGTEVTAMRQLQQAQEELIIQERLSVLGRLTAGVAHEINSPLGAVVGSTQNIEYLVQDLLARDLPGLSAHEQQLLLTLMAWPVEPPATNEQPARERFIRERFALLALEMAGSHWAQRLAEMGWGAAPQEPWEQLVSEPGRERILMAMTTVSGLRESLRTVRFAADRATRVVQALRNYMHKEDVRHESDFDLARQLRMVATLFSASGRKGVRIVQQLPEQHLVRGVEDELAQVWTNIISNAMQAVGDVGVVQVALTIEEGATIVRIGNNGPPIPPEVMARMYDPMFTTKPKGEGTGIGLSIVRRILDAHDASITCTSTSEQTVFTVCFTGSHRP